jgi:hypothetical protein
VSSIAIAILGSDPVFVTRGVYPTAPVWEPEQNDAGMLDRGDSLRFDPDGVRFHAGGVLTASTDAVLSDAAHAPATT